MNPQDLIPPEFRDADSKDTREAAVKMIHNKLDKLYAHEPNARKESAEVKELVTEHEQLTKHQRYMKQLNQSGLDVAEIQTKWHEYYSSLSDEEKREVWQEFYAEQAIIKKRSTEENSPDGVPLPEPEDEITTPKTTINQTQAQRPREPEPILSYSESKRIAKKTRGSKANKHIHKITKNHHIRSLAFGLGMGSLVIFVLLFSFFNERFIIPFIRPNTHVSATPIIVDANTSGPVSAEPKIIIPKINLEAPVVYDVPTIEEKAVQAGLERGVVHYATTPNPGEKGNSVIFGHSSGNILNKGKYKFAFLLLKSVDVNDTFIVQKDSKRYVYKVYNKYVTAPDDVSVLGANDKTATMTLITCDPPGTSTHRLIVQAEQIFPDPKANIDSSVPSTTVSQPKELPSNSPTLWQRLFGS